MKNICDWDNCKKNGEYKAPIEKDNSKKYRLLCLEHIKEFNKTDASLGDNTTEDQQYGGKGNGAKLYGLSLFDRSFKYFSFALS